MSMAARADQVEVEIVTEAEGRDLFNRAALDFLGVSGPDFLLKWDRGEYRWDDRPEVTHVAMLIPFGR
jgi:hypothetical protein